MNKKFANLLGNINTRPAPTDDSETYLLYWYKAIACALLSSRIKATDKLSPNKTDVKRMCKQMNFNQYLFSEGADILIRSGVIDIEKHDNHYKPGKDPYHAFFSNDLAGLVPYVRKAFLAFLQEHTGYVIWRPTFAFSSGMTEFLMLFFHIYKGFAFPLESFGDILLKFSELSLDFLKTHLDDSGIDKGGMFLVSSCKDWIDAKGREALLSSLYACRWVYVFKEDDVEWIYLNSNGRVALGIDPPPAAAPPCREFRVLPDFSVYAGSDLPPEVLIPLFKFCEVKKIDKVLEFKITKKALQNVSSKTSPTKELREAISNFDSIPQPVRSFLEMEEEAKPEGTLHMHYCSAIIVPDNPELLTRIRSHPKLKGYIAPHSPGGFLLIKPESNPDNFYRICKEYGLI